MYECLKITENMTQWGIVSVPARRRSYLLHSRPVRSQSAAIGPATVASRLAGAARLAVACRGLALVAL